MKNWNLVKKLQDGTIIYRNPFADTEAWYLPERKHRPFHTHADHRAEPLPLQTPQNYCAFCPAHYFETTPEKSRIEITNGDWTLFDDPEPRHIFTRTAEFRRIGNLYEIISTNYWKKNHHFQLSARQKKRKKAYLADALGYEHVRSLFEQKSKGIGTRGAQNNSDAAFAQMCDAFFAGAHELIIPRRHYIDNAAETSQLCSAGDLTPHEHYHYMRLTCHAAKNVMEDNSFITYVAIYTNWLRDAGASFEHLHRQVIGVDRLGRYITNGLALAGADKNIYQDYVQHVAIQLGFFLCENEYALAFVDIGHSFTTVSIFSKSRQTKPWMLSPDELRGMSDVMHAIHAAFGSRESVNEEWYYQPRYSDVRIPWHVLIKWRNHRHAGIESITTIYPDEFGPADLKSILLGKLARLAAEKRIGAVALDSKSMSNRHLLPHFD
ncbi:DUF4921 family protein [candidate division KSB1 bacterium]|nr:DUF4921 family protein [candidate division KSB1 bacterium]